MEANGGREIAKRIMTALAWQDEALNDEQPNICPECKEQTLLSRWYCKSCGYFDDDERERQRDATD
jgi:predicted amidophosphoribosyltransferase